MTEERKHAIFAPSSAHRLIRCPGSAVYDAALQSAESSYAREGTFAHEVGAHCLNNDLDVKDMVGKLINVDYEPLGVVSNPQDALADGAPQIQLLAQPWRKDTGPGRPPAGRHGQIGFEQTSELDDGFVVEDN